MKGELFVREILKRNLIMYVGLMIGMTLIDVFVEKSFTVRDLVVRAVSGVIVYGIFTTVEIITFNKKKKGK